MGRQVKRVLIDFNWPLNKEWEGYVNPYYKAERCQKCKGDGYSEVAKRLKNQWYGRADFKLTDRNSKPFLPDNNIILTLAKRNIQNSPEFFGTDEFAVDRETARLCQLFNKSWMHHLNNLNIEALINAGRLRDFTHKWTGKKWQQKEPPYVPSAKEINEWSIYSFGHDSINCHIVISAECKQLRKNSTCEDCHGEGDVWPDQESKCLYESWQKIEPQIGDGWQLWETVTEGSPISPVFKTPEELAAFLISDEYSWKENDKGTTYDQWLMFIKGPGWAPSLIISDGDVKTGVQAVSEIA